MKRVIILGQGRSGGTLVQRVLNTVPNSYIAGENKNFWYHIFQAYKAWEYIPIYENEIAKTKKQKPFSYNTKTDAYKPCWWNREYDFTKFNTTIYFRRLFDDHYQGANFRGFKEIRFPEDEKEFNEYLDWFRLLFPNIYFIFTVRDIKTIVNSGWWSIDDKETLLNQEKLLRSRKDAFIVEFENQDWKGLFKYLDLEYNEKEVQRILNKKL